jgi:hypothetical protein
MTGGLVRPRSQERIHVTKFIAGLFAAVVLSAGVAVAAEPPASITLPAKPGAVTFNHKAHGERVKGDCKHCHAAVTGGKIEGFSASVNKDKAHGLCHECHKKEGKGPQKCADCHKKA